MGTEAQDRIKAHALTGKKRIVTVDHKLEAKKPKIREKLRKRSGEAW